MWRICWYFPKERPYLEIQSNSSSNLPYRGTCGICQKDFWSSLPIYLCGWMKCMILQEIRDIKERKLEEAQQALDKLDITIKH